MDTPNIHDHSSSWFGTDTTIQRGGDKLMLWVHTYIDENPNVQNIIITTDRMDQLKKIKVCDKLTSKP